MSAIPLQSVFFPTTASLETMCRCHTGNEDQEIVIVDSLAQENRPPSDASGQAVSKSRFADGIAIDQAKTSDPNQMERAERALETRTSGAATETSLKRMH
jgi:hypothetical protein